MCVCMCVYGGEESSRGFGRVWVAISFRVAAHLIGSWQHMEL